MAGTEYVTVDLDAGAQVALSAWAALAQQWGCDLTVRMTPGKLPMPELTFVPNGPERVVEPNIGYVRMWE